MMYKVAESWQTSTPMLLGNVAKPNEWCWEGSTSLLTLTSVHIPWNYLNLELSKFSSFIRALIFWGSSHSTLPTHDTFKGHHTLPLNQLSSFFRGLNLTILPSAILIRFSAQCCVCLSTFPQKPNVCYLLQRTFWTHSEQLSPPCVGKSFMLSASWAFIVVFIFQRALFVTFVQIWCRTSRLPSPVC